MKKTVCGIVVALACFFASTAHAAVDPTKTSYTPKEMELRTAMREIFSQNLTWQRAVILATIGSSGDVTKAQSRLMTSQDGIGSSMGAYLGDEQGQKLADLFKQYAQLISEYSTDVLMHSDKTLTVTKMNDKMDEIATYLSQQNMVWDKATLAGKLKRYSDLLNTEMDAQSPTFGAVNAAMCDATFYQAMDIADTITFGLIKQDPGKFW